MKNKKKIWIAAAAAAAVLAGAAALLIWRGPVLMVNGTPVFQEEYSCNGQSAEQTLRSRVVMAWAEEYEPGRECSMKKLAQKREAENQRRQEQIAKGEPVYGPAEYTTVQYYKQYISECEQLIVGALEHQATQEELEAFYKEHQQEYRQIDTIAAEYSLWQQGVLTQQGTVMLDQYTVRGLTETSEELVERMLGLQPGGEIVWDVADGLQLQLRCTGREPGALASFEEVSGAVAQQYAASQFTSQLEQRMKDSTMWTFK